jgi:HAD superfamily hydrolase (TIGR01509 family)
MLKAIVFDFDGIIVDTEPLHYKAFQLVLAPHGLGYSWQEYVEHYIGFDDRDAFREVFRLAGRPLTESGLAGLVNSKAVTFQEVIGGGVDAYPGVTSLVRGLTGTIPLAICSGALRSDIVPILRQLGLESAFDIMVTAEEVTASKPDPESYRLAVQRLTDRFPDHAITPAACLAIEDTPAGIVSATGAGLRVLSITNSYPAERLTGAWKILHSLEGVDLASLRSVF